MFCGPGTSDRLSGSLLANIVRPQFWRPTARLARELTIASYFEVFWRNIMSLELEFRQEQ